MQAELDHVVIWVDDPMRSLTFYEQVVGLEPLRVEEFKTKKAAFPSVRLSPRSVIDLAPRAMAGVVNGLARKAGIEKDAAGHPANHLCLAMSRDEFVALRSRLQAAGIDTSFTLNDSFGARGKAPETFYFPDPDGNVLEARYYEDAAG
ncbi:MAG: VOC family protein [Polyangiaceae bacterium]|nr:VOC family protein [Polyangiaceae bacterium]